GSLTLYFPFAISTLLWRGSGGNSVATIRERKSPCAARVEARVTLCTIENTPTVHLTGTVRYWYCTFHQFSPKARLSRGTSLVRVRKHAGVPASGAYLMEISKDV